MKNAYEILKERGFIEQVTDEALISGLFKNGPVTCYIGFDPTASSLHIGSLVPIMALSHMQKSDNKPIALVGGGTGLIGDPSGKTEMRQVLTEEQIQKNASCIGKQLSRYLDFYGGSKALLLNNAEWLTKVKYIEFLRDIGRHFSVNRMLAAESYKMRLEKGLNFIEFNYMILQAYDYLYLFKKYGCILQMGGNDQWGNMLAGTELIRKVTAKDAHAVTFPLITTSHGHKMGKTERGTIWLEGNLTSPYEYYQYWVNCDDADVERFLKLFTFLPLDEIVVVKKLVDAQLNMAKTVLAYEAFHSRPVDSELFPSSDIPRNDVHSDISAIPRYRISKNDLERGLLITSTCAKAGLTQSMSEAKRLIEQGGIYVGNRQVKTVNEKILVSDFEGTKELRIRKGKKKYLVIELGN